MKKIAMITAILMAFIICISLSSCNGEKNNSGGAANNTAKQQAELDKKRDEIANIINSTQAINGWALTYGQGIKRTFHNYKWSFEDYPEKDNCYIVTFTGTYSPNPKDLPEISQNGTLSLLVDVVNKTVSVYQDPNQIVSTAFVLIAIP